MPGYAATGYREPVTSDPVLIAYAVKRDRRTKKPIWTRIGQAYPHDVGAGLTLLLDVIPLDGRVVLLELDEADDRRILSEAQMARAAGRPPREPANKSRRIVK